MSSEYKRSRDYELMVIFHPELSEEDLQSEIGKVEGHITAGEGSITLINRETPWGRRRLAYAIRHDSRDIRDGVYVLYYFTAEAEKLVDMEREIKLQDRILRYLLTQQSAPIMEPAPEEEEAAAEGAEGEAAEAAEAPAAEVAEVTEEATAEPVAEAEKVTESTEPAPEAAEEAAPVEVASEETTADAPADVAEGTEEA